MLHLYRVVALDQAIQQGVLFPRWLPDLAFGYGLPLFIFYAPLAYYLTEIFNLLGLGVVGAINLSFSLAFLVSASGAYLFIKDLFGLKAGLLAAVAYVYAPYQLFNVFSRGSFPAAWAAALLPFTFWAFGRLNRTRQPNDLALSACFCALLLITHNISSLIFFPLLVFYVIIALFPKPSLSTEEGTQPTATPTLSSLLRRSGLIIAALLLGGGLAAFFWLPAMIEKDFVQIERVITPPDFDYHAHFVTLSDLFSLPTPANTGLLNPKFPLTLGLAHVSLSVIGLLSLALRWLARKSSSSSRFPAPLLKANVFALISLSIAIFLMLPFSVGVWDRLPLIAFVQHPNRLLSVTALLLAILAGGAVYLVPARFQRSLTAIGVVIIFISAVPLLYPRYYDSLPAPPTLSGMFTYERAIGAVGTTSFGEYIPIWVDQIPHQSPLEPTYHKPEPVIPRLDAAYLPAEAQLESAHYDFNQAELTIDSPAGYPAVFHTFYFPGWQAFINEQPAPVVPISERGLLSVDMPAGRHTLQLYFGETPMRRLANGISLLTSIIVIGVVLRGNRRRFFQRTKLPLTRLKTFDDTQHSFYELRTFLVLALMLIGIKFFYVDRYDTPLKRVFDDTDHPNTAVNFGHQLTLLDYDLEVQSVAPGQTIEVTAYWQAPQPLLKNYSILAQIVDDQQHLYAGQDNLHPGQLPTTRWEPWGFVQDPHHIQIPPGTPPGNYFLIIGPYDPATWQRLLVIDGDASKWPDVVSTPIKIVAPDHPPSESDLGIVWPATAQPDPRQSAEIMLLGAAPERSHIQPNDFFRLALFWETSTSPQINYRINLRLLDETNQILLEQVNQPSHDRYPTTQWIAGERIRDNHALWIPPGFPDGPYRVQVRLLDAFEQPIGAWVELGSIN